MHICHYVNVYISPKTLIFENFRGGARTPGTPFLGSGPASFSSIDEEAYILFVFAEVKPKVLIHCTVMHMNMADVFTQCKIT